MGSMQESLPVHAISHMLRAGSDYYDPVFVLLQSLLRSEIRNNHIPR